MLVPVDTNLFPLAKMKDWLKSVFNLKNKPLLTEKMKENDLH